MRAYADDTGAGVLLVEQHVEAALDVADRAGSNPAPHMASLKAAGVKVIHKAVSVRHVVKAEALGVDAVSMRTRFVATTEAAVHENVKRQILSCAEVVEQMVGEAHRLVTQGLARLVT